MFYVMKQRTKWADNHPDANVYDRLDEFKTYEDALEYLKRNKPDKNTLILESLAVADSESIFDFAGGKVIEY